MTISRSPSGALLPFFGGGFPYRKKKRYPSSNSLLEYLDIGSATSQRILSARTQADFGGLPASASSPEKLGVLAVPCPTLIRRGMGRFSMLGPPARCPFNVSFLRRVPLLKLTTEKIIGYTSSNLSTEGSSQNGGLEKMFITERLIF